PAITHCARCDRPGPHTAFHVAAGGAVCVHCRPPGAATPAPGVFALLDALDRGRWAETESADAAVRRQASGLVAAHLQWHLERQLRSLPLVERGRTEPPISNRADDVARAVRQDGDRDSTTYHAPIV
ncbi:DNA repair protein RecO, partial [Rhodococcus sp. R1101]